MNTDRPNPSLFDQPVPPPPPPDSPDPRSKSDAAPRAGGAGVNPNASPDRRPLTHHPDPPARRNGPRTSREAARSMRPIVKTILDRVLRWFIEQGPHGGTNEEMTDALNLRTQTGTARTNDLKKCGLVRKSGRYRPTSSGRRATVWIATTLADLDARASDEAPGSEGGGA